MNQNPKNWSYVVRQPQTVLVKVELTAITHQQCLLSSIITVSSVMWCQSISDYL